MATHNKTLQLIATKLGLNDEEKVLRKAAEFERLLQTKTIAGVNITDTSKVVICLDLASFVLGIELDVKSAIKYSGLKQSNYSGCRKVVENLLEINSERLTVGELCVRLQCSGVQALAENILEAYRRQAKMEIDLNLPQYVCMAVYQACRINKVKVKRSKLTETSRLRAAQWGKLEADWAKLVDANFARAKKKGRPTKTVVEDTATENNEVEKCPTEEISSEPQTESYEDWKKRMLEAAYEELKKTEQIKKSKENQQISPRKKQCPSPAKNNVRTTPRKYSFNLNKVNLLFPPMDIVSQTTESSKHHTPRKDNLLSPRKDVMFRSPSPENSPRRSPRKTPQKFSPYKTPSGKNGVRLLFPKNI